MEELTALRKKIGDVDDQLLRLMNTRLKIARKIALHKLNNNLPIKDFRVEKEVLNKSRKTAKNLGMYQEFAEAVVKLLIQYSVKAQEELHKKRKVSKSGKKKKILIVGGLGEMGGWLARFYDSLGHRVSLFDSAQFPKWSGEPYKIEQDLLPAALSSDIITLATPISETPKTIEALADAKINGLVFDICSLKSPLLKSIQKAEASGLNITSIHPMFGPDAELLSGRNIILCETGNKKLCDEVEDLFKRTMASIFRMPIEEHDPLVSYVLGLSHLVNLVFGKTLCDGKFDFSTLEKISSTTFRSQLDVAIPVLNENQDLYYEIETENSFTKELLGQMEAAFAAYKNSILSRDRFAFKEFMEKNRKYFGKG